MSIEKPISTIRRAIQESAEENASKEFLNEPEQRHYKQAIDFYKLLRKSSPEFLEIVIPLTAKRKELKDEMGLELYKVFEDAWENLLRGPTGYESKMKEGMAQITETKKLSSDEYNQEKINLTQRILNEESASLRHDSIISSAFSGNEEILNKAIEFEISYLCDLLESYSKYQKLKIIE